MTWTESLANSLGASEDGLKLILGQLFAYPIVYLFREYFIKFPPSIQHLYFTFTGILIAYWSIGGETIFHSCTCIVTTYFLLKLLGPTKLSVILVFSFNFIYLLIGYYAFATAGYDVCWTMPHCVLCLRLIAIAIDYKDGQKPEKSLSKDQLKTNLSMLPSFIEIMSQCWFIGGYFVGPQFSMRKYQEFIQRNLNQDLPSPYSFGLRRLTIGILYMTGHVVGTLYIPVTYVESQEFINLGFFKRSLFFTLWVKIILAKYIAAWLLAEGAVVISGLAYEGVDDQGNTIWTGGANVKLRLFESATKFEHIIQSFNINTNNWVASYIYKRLKFLGNRLYSQLVTLIFLAMWHGIHSGYYVTFFNEFIMVNFEKDLSSFASKNQKVKKLLDHPGASTLIKLVGKVYVLFFIPHCFLPFAFLKSSRYIPIIYNTGGLVYICFLFWPLYSIPIKMLFKDTKENLSETDGDVKKEK